MHHYLRLDSSRFGSLNRFQGILDVGDEILRCLVKQIRGQRWQDVLPDTKDEKRKTARLGRYHGTKGCNGLALRHKLQSLEDVVLHFKQLRKRYQRKQCEANRTTFSSDSPDTSCPLPFR